MFTPCFLPICALSIPLFHSCSHHANQGSGNRIQVIHSAAPRPKPPLFFSSQNGAHIGAVSSAQGNQSANGEVKVASNTPNADGLPTSGLQKQPMTQAEQLVIENTSSVFSDGRYGACPLCSNAIAIPGLVHAFCPKCGWIDRRDNVQTVAPGHHD